jgi:hypothetical protein
MSVTKLARDFAPKTLGPKKRDGYWWKRYSTAKSAQRLSARLSTRPSGRKQFIEM